MCEFFGDLSASAALKSFHSPPSKELTNLVPSSMANTVGPQWHLWCPSARWPFWTHGLFRGNTDSSFTLESLGGGVTPQTSTFYLHSSSSISKLTWSPVLCNFLLERGIAEESGLILVISLKSHSPKVRDTLISLFWVGKETLSSRKCPQIWSPFPTSKLIYTFYLCKGRFQIFHCALYSKKFLPISNWHHL